jgi:hypothetical protein
MRPGGQRASAVYGGFLEYLLAHLAAPRQAGHDGLDHAVSVDSEHPAGVFGFLPRVKGVDQIKPGPRHLHLWVGLTLGERGFHHCQALVEREPGRPGVAGQ